MKIRLRGVAVLLGLLWLMFVYASFYLVEQQRPFANKHLLAFSSALANVLTAGAIASIGAAIGRRACCWLGLRHESPAEEFILGSGIGLGALALAVLGIGLLGWLYLLIVALFLGVLAVLLASDLIALLRGLWVTLPAWHSRRGLVLYVGSIILLSLSVSLTPPIDWDGLFYHLTMPKLYLQSGRITPMTDMPHQYFPGLMEMLYLLAMLLRGDVAAKLLHFFYISLLGGLIYLLTERHVKQGLGWYAVTAYASMPMVPIVGSWAYNDLALAFYMVAALYALLNWFEQETSASGSSAWLVLSGAFCGLAMGVKYTSFVLPLVLAGLVVWRFVRTRRGFPFVFRTLSILAAVTLLVALPWYLRNWASAGNPVYPFAYRLFGGVDWDLWRAAWYARAGTGIGQDLGGLIKLPWTLTLGVRDMNFYDGQMGPLFLLALPFLIAWSLRLFDRRRSRPGAVSYLLVFALVQYGFWTVGVVTSRSLFQSRLLLPAFVALCAPMVYVFDRLRDLDMPALSLRRVIGMSAVLVLAANLAGQSLLTLRIRPLPVIVGEESREEFLHRNLGAHYAAMQAVNQQVPESGRVLFLWEPRSYYCERPAQPDPILERWMWLLHQYDGDLGAIADALVNGGYTHILLYRSGLEFMRETRLDPISDEDIAAWDTFASRFLRLETVIDGDYELYQMKDLSGQGP